MSRNTTTANRREAAALSIVLAIACATALSLALAGCKNAIADAAEGLREEAVAPTISVSLASGAELASSGSLSFGLVSVGGASDIKLTIKNQGVHALAIAVADIALTPGSTTASGIFSIAAAPAATVQSGASTSITIRFAPVAEDSASATLTIPTNDPEASSFSLSLSGSGWAIDLSTASVSAIAWATATSGGSITSAGGKAVAERGICWGTSPDPTVSDGKRADAGTGTGSYTCVLSGLLPGTYYYVRAYATTNAGATAYGLSQTFTTVAATAPTTATISAINATSATAGCTAAVDTGLTLGECGVCWSASSGPTTAGSHASGTSGASIALTGLSLATTYYARAYTVLYSASASNTVTVYGDEKTFKTVGYLGPSGGYVFYDQGSVINGWRYLEAAPSDLGSYAWGPDASVGTGTGIGTGSQNTYDLCATGGYNYAAAAYSFNATYGGNTGFFLPSKDELDLMLRNLASNGLGGPWTNFWYWSSSQLNTYQAYLEKPSLTSSTYLKSYSYSVRAARAY